MRTKQTTERTKDDAADPGTDATDAPEGMEITTRPGASYVARDNSPEIRVTVGGVSVAMYRNVDGEMLLSLNGSDYEPTTEHKLDAMLRAIPEARRRLLALPDPAPAAVFALPADERTEDAMLSGAMPAGVVGMWTELSFTCGTDIHANAGSDVADPEITLSLPGMQAGQNLGKLELTIPTGEGRKTYCEDTIRGIAIDVRLEQLPALVAAMQNVLARAARLGLTTPPVYKKAGAA